MPKKKKATYKNSVNRGFAVIGNTPPRRTQEEVPTNPSTEQPSNTIDNSSSNDTTSTTTTQVSQETPTSPVSKTKFKTTTSLPLEQPEAEADMVLRLAKRFGSVNDRKSITMFNELSQPPTEEGKVRSFALTSNIESDLLQVLRHQGRLDTFGMIHVYIIFICFFC